MADEHARRRHLDEVDLIVGYGMTPEEFDRRLRDAGALSIEAANERRTWIAERFGRRLPAPVRTFERGVTV